MRRLRALGHALGLVLVGVVILVVVVVRLCHFLHLVVVVGRLCQIICTYFQRAAQQFGPEARAKAIVFLEIAMGVGGFTYLCVAASCCGSCYVEPCVHPAGLKMLYKVNSSLCFAGITTGMFLCFLAGWGCLLTLRRRASVMGFGHFFGAVCVTFLVCVQSAGMWGDEARLLQEFTAKRIYEYAVIDSVYQQMRIKQNRALHRSCRFLFIISVIFSIALMILAPLYFLSRDVYDGDPDADTDADPNRRQGDGTENPVRKTRPAEAEELL